MSNDKSKSSGDLMRNLLISGAVFMTIVYFGPRLMPPPPKTSGQNAGTTGDNTGTQADGPTGTTAPGTSAPNTGTESNNTGAEGTGQREDTIARTPGNSGDTSGGLTVAEADETATVILGPEEDLRAVDDNGSSSSPYRTRLILSNIGASVESAFLMDHDETRGSPVPYKMIQPLERPAGNLRSLAIEKLDIDGQAVSLLNARWHPEAIRENDRGMEAAFTLVVRENGTDLLNLRRWFLLPKQPIESEQHDLVSGLAVTNLTTTPRRVIVSYRGAVGIRMADTRMDDRVVDWGIRLDSSIVEGQRTTSADINSKLEVALFDKSTAEGSNLAWAATANKYFTCTLCPVTTTPDGEDSTSVAESTNLVRVTAIDADNNAATLDDFSLRFVTQPETVGENQTAKFPVEIYLGEKDADAFRSVEKYRQRNFYYQVSQNYGMCTFVWLVELMIWLLNSLYGIFGDFGVAIIIMVVIVRTFLHPITKKGQVNMVRMQTRMGEFQPKLEELKKKFGTDKAKLQQETMKLYREEGINPAGQLFTCLPMLLQMPIWFALFISLSNNIEIRHEGFLFTWVKDLTGQDALYTFASPLTVPLFGWQLESFNLLPILVAISMYVQQKLQPKPKPNPNMSEQQAAQQEMMQKMMPMMSIMMLLIFYKMPAGLNLYIMTSSFFGALEQSYIRNHIKEREEAGTLHKPKQQQGPAKSGKTGLLQRLQQMAEQAQKQQVKSAKPKRRR